MIETYIPLVDIKYLTSSPFHKTRPSEEYYKRNSDLVVLLVDLTVSQTLLTYLTSESIFLNSVE